MIGYPEHLTQRHFVPAFVLPEYGYQPHGSRTHVRWFNSIRGRPVSVTRTGAEEYDQIIFVRHPSCNSPIVKQLSPC
jgi:hypothetical protein